MPKRTIAAHFMLCIILLVSVSRSDAKDEQRLHPGPWPIWHWHNHQPTERQLDSLRASDVTPQQGREIDRLYMQLEGGDPQIIAPEKKSR